MTDWRQECERLQAELDVIKQGYFVLFGVKYKVTKVE